MKQFIDKYKPTEHLRICATHPLGRWRDGYINCFWGFRLKQFCRELKEEKGKEVKNEKNR